MTFEEWSSTREKVASIEAAIGADDRGPGYIYHGYCFIEICQPPYDGSGRYCLTIENYSRCSDNLHSLEALLWMRWAKDEVA